MRYEIIIESEGQGVIVKWHGIAAANEIRAVNDEIYSEGRAGVLRYQIWDFTEAVKATEPQVSFEDARLFAIQDSKAGSQNSEMLIALVGTKKYFSGLETLYGIYTDIWAKNVKYKIFERLEEARDWVAKEYSKS